MDRDSTDRDWGSSSARGHVVETDSDGTCRLSVATDADEGCRKLAESRASGGDETADGSNGERGEGSGQMVVSGSQGGREGAREGELASSRVQPHLPLSPHPPTTQNQAHFFSERLAQGGTSTWTVVPDIWAGTGRWMDLDVVRAWPRPSPPPRPLSPTQPRPLPPAGRSQVVT